MLRRAFQGVPAFRAHKESLTAVSRVNEEKGSTTMA
jgi:hypothetical protein